MIKKLFLSVIVVLFTSSIFAQGNFNKGDKALNIGIGIGDAYGYGFSVIPAFNGSFEAGIVDIPNVGVIGVGGFVGTKINPQTNVVYVHSVVSGRAAFHFQFFDTGDFDLYAGLGTGLEFWNANFDYDPYDYSGSGLFWEEFAGARWMKNDKFGFFAEVGYGVSFLKAGITLKL